MTLPIQSKTARPADRFESWVGNPLDRNYLPLKLAEYERISKEVQGSTFHLHGSVKGETITPAYVQGHAKILRDNIGSSDLSEAEKHMARERVKIAQADLSLYAAHSCLWALDHSTEPLWRCQIDVQGEQISHLFAASRNRDDIRPTEKKRLAKIHEDLVRETKTKVSRHNVIRDTTLIKTRSAELTPQQQYEAAKRATGNLNGMIADEKDPKRLENLRYMLCDIDFYYNLVSNVPHQKRQPSTYVF